VDLDQVVVNSRLSSLQGGMSFLMNGSPVKGENGQSLRVSSFKNSMRTNTMMHDSGESSLTGSRM
jgi:hypothetical protein